jgi:Guanylate-binding protein, N-terminal domain/Guanylate-binding protein, C-terminal domain
MNKSLPLVTWNDTLQKFIINDDAIRFLKSVGSPIGVVSVAGMYRTGKSYLLNRVLLNRSNAFSVGPSINPCTKGIWIWGEAILGSTEDGTPCNMLIIDTEGMGGLDKDANYDSRIFSIAALISSCFVYNSTGSIDENAIENLGLIVNISKMIQVNDTVNFFPKFLWVVRDFALQLIENDGSVINTNEYLEKILQPQKGFSDAIETKNRIRNALNNYFRERECVTLVRPTINEQDLQKLDQLELSQLRNEFVEQIISLRRKVMFEAKIKKVNGQVVNGDLLGKLLESYVESFNSGNVPNIEMTWDYICSSQNKTVLENAVQEYEKVLNDAVIPLEEQELKSIHQDGKKQGIKYLSKHLIGPDKSFIETFKKIVNEKYTEIKIQNKYELKIYFMTYLKDKYTLLDSAIKSGEFNNTSSFEKKLKVLEKEYYDNTLEGEIKTEIFLTFAREISNKVSDYLISNLNNELKVQKSISADHVSKLSSEIQELNELINTHKKESGKVIEKLQEELVIANTKENILKDQISKLNLNKEDLENFIKDLNKTKSTEIAELQKKIEEFDETIKEIHKNNNSKISEIQDEKALILQKITFTENTLEEYKAKEKSNSDKLKEIRAENSQTVKSIQSKFENQIEKLNEKLEEKAKENNDLENEIELKEALLEETQGLLNSLKSEYNEYKTSIDSEINSLKKQIQDKEFQYSKKLEKMEQEYKTSTSRIRARLSETEKKLRNSEELLRNDMAIWAQDNAILVQKIEFLEQEVEEQKLKREEEKKHFKSVISTMESSISNL